VVSGSGLSDENLKYVTQSCMWLRAEYIAETFLQLCSVVADPDSIGAWIRIWIRNPDPDSGGQKWPRKM
jgi:hypothetical protein